jgi:uncharacterized protein (TIGR02246 family)
MTCLALAIVAFASPQLAAAEDLASVKAMVAAANADWVEAMKAHDAKRACAPYAKDAIDIKPDGGVLSGRGAIEQATARRLATGPQMLGGVLVDDGVAQAAEGLVYEWGHADLRYRDAAGKAFAVRGHFLTVWRKAADGRWRIIRNLDF